MTSQTRVIMRSYCALIMTRIVTCVKLKSSWIRSRYHAGYQYRITHHTSSKRHHFPCPLPPNDPSFHNLLPDECTPKGVYHMTSQLVHKPDEVQRFRTQHAFRLNKQVQYFIYYLISFSLKGIFPHSLKTWHNSVTQGPHVLFHNFSSKNNKFWSKKGKI